jgi:hypothetical protein
MSVFLIFIKSSSNLLALTSFSVYIEDVKEKDLIPNLHQIFIKSSSNLIALTFVSVYIEDVKEKNPSPLYLKIKVPRMKSPLTLVKSLLAVACVAAVSAVSAAPASAFNFSNIAGGDPVGDAYANNFGFTLDNQGGLAVFNIFNFGNPSANNMFIAGVFFDDNGYLSSSSAPWVNVSNVGEVAFSGGASNAQLPQGGKSFSTDYAFFSNNGAGNAFGIQGGEKLGLTFAANYNNVLAALNSGELKIGLHVQALPNGASDSYISSNGVSTENTPEPLTMLAAGAAVGFGTMFKKQRAQAQKAE